MNNYSVLYASLDNCLVLCCRVKLKLWKLDQEMDYRMKRFENALDIFQKWKELFFVLVIFILSAHNSLPESLYLITTCICDHVCKHQPFEGND